LGPIPPGPIVPQFARSANILLAKFPAADGVIWFCSLEPSGDDVPRGHGLMDWCFFSLYLLFLLALGIYREQDPQTKKRKKCFDLRFLSNKHAAGQL
jgi:hypothetical protein